MSIVDFGAGLGNAANELGKPGAAPIDFTGTPGAQTVATAEDASMFGQPSPETAKLAAMLGQMGQAFAPKDSWQGRLGGVAANMGSQKLQQMAGQEAEKRQMEFYKELFKDKKPHEVNNILAAVKGTTNGPAGSLASTEMLSQTPEQVVTPLSRLFGASPHVKDLGIGGLGTSPYPGLFGGR